jgi:hypothetical protein
MTLNAEQRRALAMLATSGHNGATQPLLVASEIAGRTTRLSAEQPWMFAAGLGPNGKPAFKVAAL